MAAQEGRLLLLQRVADVLKRRCVAGPLPAAARRELIRAAASEDEEEEFLRRLQRRVRAHHAHAHLSWTFSLPSSSSQKCPPKTTVRLQRAPVLRWHRDARIGYVKFYTYVMEPCEPLDPRPPFVDACRAKLARWLAPAAGCRGLVIDLRKHHGGSCRPFLHAVGPALLDHRALLSLWVPPGNRRRETVQFYDGDKQTSVCVSSLSTPQQQALINTTSSPVPIAVLIGKGTSSSGEIAAAMFAGKAGVRTFGQRTSGALSVNEGYTLSHPLQKQLRVDLLVPARRVRTTDGALHAQEYLEPDQASTHPKEDAMAWLLRAAASTGPGRPCTRA